MHSATLIIAITLLLFHAIWATIVLALKKKMFLNFLRFGILVWLLWLIPIISDAISGASH